MKKIVMFHSHGFKKAPISYLNHVEFPCLQNLFKQRWMRQQSHDPTCKQRSSKIRWTVRTSKGDWDVLIDWDGGAPYITTHIYHFARVINKFHSTWLYHKTFATQNMGQGQERSNKTHEFSASNLQLRDIIGIGFMTQSSTRWHFCQARLEGFQGLSVPVGSPLALLKLMLIWVWQSTEIAHESPMVKLQVGTHAHLHHKMSQTGLLCSPWLPVWQGRPAGVTWKCQSFKIVLTEAEICAICICIE